MRMTTNAPDPNTPRQSVLQAMLARLRGMVEEKTPAETNTEALVAGSPEHAATGGDATAPGIAAWPSPPEFPLAQPVTAEPVSEQLPTNQQEAAPEESPPLAPVVPRLCPLCQ